MSQTVPPLVDVKAPALDRARDRLLIPSDIGVPTRPPSDVIFEVEGEAFSQAWSVSAIAPVGVDRSRIAAIVDETFEAASMVFDRMRANSEIQRFNAAPAGFWALSDSLWGLLDATMDVGDETDGAVDPTLGALIDLWGAAGPPDIEALEAIKPVTGWQGLRMNRPAQAALQPGGLILDFEAVLSGHLADAVSDRLSQAGASSHRVKVGPVVRGVGVRPDGQPWWVALPRSGVPPLTPIVAALVDRSLATVDRRNGASIIDARQGGPVSHDLTTVTVLHRSAFRAQAMARTLMVMGPFEGSAYAEAMGIAAHFVTEGARGSEERTTPAMAAQLDTPGPATA